MPTKKKNGFAIFMAEKKPELERKLKRNISMKELPEMLYDEWQILPQDQKELYKCMAKSNNNGNKEKLDCRGIPISLILQKQEEERMKKQEMEKEILRIVDTLETANAIPKETFFVICISHYLHLENGSYLPAEIGVCQFSFAEGIKSCFHKILPVEIPKGYRYEAMQHSESTHNLLLHVAGESKENNFDAFYKYLLENRTKPPIVYTQNDLMESVEFILKDVHESGQVLSSFPVKVYSLDYLFCHLYSACLLEIPESIATHILTSSTFEWSPNTACLWHMECAPDSANFCALNFSKRWIYNMCNGIRLQDTFGVIPVKMKHLPEVPYKYENAERLGSPIKGAASIRSDVPLKKSEGLHKTRSFKASKIPDSSKDDFTNSDVTTSKKPGEGLRGLKEMAKYDELERSVRKKVGGMTIACLGLTGFGRGLRRVSS